MLQLFVCSFLVLVFFFHFRLPLSFKLTVYTDMNFEIRRIPLKFNYSLITQNQRLQTLMAFFFHTVKLYWD